MLIVSVKNNLNQIVELIQQLSNEEFCEKHSELSKASIGEHTRHIIELYQCLLQNYDNGCVNYDLRKRNVVIQTNVEEAIKNIEILLLSLDKINKNLMLVQGENPNQLIIETNYFRELLYNLEHSIHHQALIKVVLHKFKNVKVSSDFGIARSTIEYRMQCAQ
mgnify:CR=1 FL=1